MKLKHLLSILLPAALLSIGCTELSKDSFDNIKLDNTFLSIPSEGGSVALKVTATEDWKFVIDETWPEAISFNKDESGSTYKAKHDFWGNLTNPEEQIKKRTATWLTASVLEGKAGETTVNFTAEAFDNGREFTLGIVCGSNKQYVVVRQGSLVPVSLTSAEIIEKAVVGGAYQTEGIVTQLGNYASYGAFWVNDGTSTTDVQVYGSTEESRKAYPNLEVGDYVKFTGTWSSYKNFENVEIIKMEKSLVKAVTTYFGVPKQGMEIAIKIAYKGDGVFPKIPSDCDWIVYDHMEYTPGIPSKLVPSPADTAKVFFTVLTNEDDARECKLSFTSYSTNDKKEVISSEAFCTVSQKSGLAYFEEPFTAEPYKFTANDVTLTGGLTYVWKFDASNKYMKASAYKGGNKESKSLLESAEIDLTDAESATLTFEHAINYFNDNDPKTLLTVLARKVGDTEWTTLEGVNYPETQGWTFVESGAIDLSSFKKSKIQIAFCYTSTTRCAPTWEIRKVAVK